MNICTKRRIGAVLLIATPLLFASCSSGQRTDGGQSHEPAQAQAAPAAPATATDEPETIVAPGATLVVFGLGCPLCANNLDLELGAIAGVTGVEVDLSTGEVGLSVADGASVPRSVIASTVEDAGFTLKSVRAN